MRDALETLNHRFDASLEAPPEKIDDPSGFATLAGRRSFRSFEDKALSMELLNVLCAAALSSPSKSDLQQRDIVIVRDREKKARLAEVVTGQDWVASAPELLVFCGNSRRQRQIHEWRGHPFVNDHLDCFFNAAVDAAIAMQAFISAAESIGLGCCAISGIRNDCDAVSELLELPDHVFPVVGLGVGWPAWEGRIALRMPLDATVHVDRFDETQIRSHIDAYDARRRELQPMRNQRQPDRFGTAEAYTWSEDKARQYASPERTGFGAFVKAKGFMLR